jgi:Xaa-Pro aminopeptidase
MLLLFRGDGFDANFFHSSGVDIDHCFFISHGAQRTLLVPKMNERIARASFRGRVVVYQDAMKSLERLLAGRKARFDGSSMSARMASKIRRFCRLEDSTEELLAERARKRPDEVALVRRAVRETKEILSSIDWNAAATEEDVHRQLLRMTLERGLEPAFMPIVSTDRNTSYPHYRAGKKKLGGLVMVDYGVRFGHYCADITRCYIRDGDRRKKEQYERLQGICHFIADALPGLEHGRDVAALAEELVSRAGFPKMPHSIGHGVGLDIHEFPRLGAKSEDAPAGAALAVEPAFYLPRYGMRYEETVFCDGKRSRIL